MSYSNLNTLSLHDALPICTSISQDEVVEETNRLVNTNEVIIHNGESKVDVGETAHNKEVVTGRDGGEETQNLSKEIQVSAGEKNIYFVLHDSAMAVALFEQLPMTVEVSNYSNNEKIFYPLQSLGENEGSLVMAALAGTLAYYAPWGNVVMFYGNNGPANGLYQLGYCTEGIEYIGDLQGQLIITAVK